MTTVTTPQLHISFDLAEKVLLQLRAAAKATGQESFLDAAKSLKAEIDHQTSINQPEH